MEQITIKKNLTITDSYDVIVAGGGPAGICAAVSAARMGKRVALIERYGVLGGNLTCGHVGPILGSVSSGTMRDELMKLLGVPDNDMLGVIGVAHDMECAKRVLTDFVRQSGAEVYLQTAVVDVIVEKNRVQGLVLSGKSGLFALKAYVTIDATGDGDIAFFAGAEYEYGRGDGLAQPVTLEFIIGDVDESRAITCIGEIDNVQYHGERFVDYTGRCSKMGVLPMELSSVRLHRTAVPGTRCVNTTQVNGINATQVKELFKAEAELRSQIGIVTDFLHSHVDGYEYCRVISSAVTLGVRETRRFAGIYMLTDNDVETGAKFSDAMVHDANFIIDIHNPIGGGQAEGVPAEAKPYDIPYGCFVPKEVDGLYLAGRCISGTHRAHASYRVMSICMAMGQAVGVAAALCVQQNKLPRELSVVDVQFKLQKNGVNLFG